MEEYFDILDEKGNYTGKIETRKKCHKEGLYHKAVVVFIMNSKGQVLLQKRSANKRMWPNMWDVTVGGHVETGEFGRHALIREVKEETNLDLDKDGEVDSNLINQDTDKDGIPDIEDPETLVNYKVEHYKQNVTLNGYENPEIETKQGRNQIFPERTMTGS